MRGYRTIKYSLFCCCYVFWVASSVLVAAGVYAKIAKEKDVIDTLTVDPALVLILIGSVMFFINVFGCLGALRNAKCLLRTFLGILLVILLLQIGVTVLGYIFSEKVIQRTEQLMLRALVGYREDLDLENAIDFIQKKTVMNTMCGYGVQRAEGSSAQEEVYTAGCLEQILWWSKHHLLLVGGLAGALLLVELCLVCLAAAQISRIRVEQRRVEQRRVEQRRAESRQRRKESPWLPAVRPFPEPDANTSS
ncbi:tetraspanin-33 isoform X2 [Gadus macrocephalus]|uniref:tetraspanin-33 isoform X2 n=1 Tax=Gadus macrocephalus TaxID=80720 RepID=UPI0028CBBF26|nr:tetraspanin-33 isoform X2 [Gadus macrocephalus]